MDLNSIQPRPCSKCGQTKDLTILQGAEMEAICLDCLSRIDPAQAAILKTIQDRRK